MLFTEKLVAAQTRNDSWLCIGLDTDPTKLPECVRDDSDSVVSFNHAIIEACRDVACAFKPNLGFYLSQGSKGIDSLARTIEAIPPDVPIVLDAKFGDIDSTAREYARFAFDVLRVDAVTVSPYLGADALAPFLDYADRAIFVLAHTSNRGARDLQDLITDNMPLYVHVARLVGGLKGPAEAGLVVGATYPKQLETVRAANPNAVYLIPGVGAQGGRLEGTVRFGSNSKGIGPLINASRSILYASQGDDFALAARRAALKQRAEINALRTARRQDGDPEEDQKA